VRLSAKSEYLPGTQLVFMSSAAMTLKPCAARATASPGVPLLPASSLRRGAGVLSDHSEGIGVLLDRPTGPGAQPAPTGPTNLSLDS